MGEAKQRRRRAKLGANVSLVDDPHEAMARLTQGVGNTVGKPMSLALSGAGLIPQAIQRAKIMVKQTTTESHLWHYAFMARDRIRTGELNPWTCVIWSATIPGSRRCPCSASSTILARLRAKTSLPS